MAPATRVLGGHLPNSEIKGMMRRAFTPRIIRYLCELVPDSSTGAFARTGLVGGSLQLAASESIWNYLENSPDDSHEDAEPAERSSSGDGSQAKDQKDDPEDNGSQPPEDGSGDDEDEPEECVIIYVRVSSNEQKEDGRSLESQVEELTSIVDDNPNMKAFTSEPIRDEGETGTNFDREGIKRVAELAQNDEVTHLLVDTIDRIGRSVAETILFIKHLRQKCDVKLRTRTQEFDLLKPPDKMQVTMLSAMADFGTMNRARSAHRSKADNFLEENRWNSWYGDSVPFGYEFIEEDYDKGSWIQPIAECDPVIQDIYEEFLRTENYVEVKDIINTKYPDIVEKYAGGDDNKLSRQQVRSILSRSVYKGQPTLPVTSLKHYDPYPSVDDSDLAIVSEETFDKVQEIVADMKDTYSSNDDFVFSPSDYAEEFSPFVVETVSPLVRLECPKCKELLISNGQYLFDEDGRHASRMYQCPHEECDYQERWPDESERDLMEMLDNIDEFHSIL